MAITHYFLGKNGLEYSTERDAEKHGGGCVAKRPNIRSTKDLYEDYKTMDGEPLKAPEGEINYESMTKEELQEIVKEHGVKGYALMKKPTLIEKVKELFQK